MSRKQRKREKPWLKEQRRKRAALPKPRSRQCGGCTACCYVMGIKTGMTVEGWGPSSEPDATTEKPGFEHCPHALGSQMAAGGGSTVGGCGIYQDRPPPCREFKCHWLDQRLPGFEVEDRPDKIGLVITTWAESGTEDTPGRPMYAVQAFEVWPGAAEGVRAKRMIERFRRSGVAVLIIRPKDRTVLTPLTIEGHAAWQPRLELARKLEQEA